MAVSHLFEVGQRVLEEKSTGRGSPAPVFMTLVLHQCASLKRMMRGEWEWGRILWQASTAKWSTAGLWQHPDAVEVIEYPFGEAHNWTCFEDLYIYPSYGNFVPGPKDLAQWQNTIHDVIGRSEGVSLGGENLHHRCRDGQLRIVIFQ